MMDLEDGEVESSEEEEKVPCPPPPANSMEFPDLPDDSDYVILDRPKPKLPLPDRSTTASASQSQSSMSFGSTPPIQPKATIASGKLGHLAPTNVQESSFSFSDTSYGRGNYRKARYSDLGVSDLFESDKDSSASADSDDDNNFGKRSRMGLPAGNSGFAFQPQAYPAEPSTSGLSMFQAHASKFQQQRKPNTIWSSVIQEEQISNVFEGAKLVEPSRTNVEVERGPETYYYERKLPPQRPPRQRRDSDSSDISSEGLSDNALHYLRDGISYNEDETGDGEELSEHSLPKAFTGRTTSRKSSGVKRRRNQSKIKAKVTQKLKKLEATKLAAYMAKKLIEEKVKLLERAVEILGKENCIRTFFKTLKIEKRGGLMIKSQTRRRTPGGVFLYLIRGDRRFPKSQIDLIFRDERQFNDRCRKKKIAVGRLRKKSTLEKAQQEMGEGNMNVDGSESSEDSTAMPDQEQDGTDTGQLGDDSTQESSFHDKDTTEGFAGGSSEMQCDG